MIGAGIVNVGPVGIIAGWSAPVQMLTGEPILSPAMKTWTGLFQLPGSMGHGEQCRRPRKRLALAGRDYVRRPMTPMFRWTSLPHPSHQGSLGVTGHFGLQAMDVSAVGMRLGGILFPTPITLGGPTPGHISRSALESFAYTIRANLEQLEREAGIAASHISLGGGLSRLSTFRQILPQVLGRPISMSRQPDTTAIGAAMIARTAIGEFDSLTEPATMLSRRAQTMEPDPAEAAEYQDHYEQWLEVHESIGPLLR